MTMPTDIVNALCPFPLDHKPFTCPFIFVTVFLHLSWQEIKEYCISGCKLFSALIQEERCLICVLVSSLLCTCSFQISFQISYLLTSLESLLTSITYERLHVILRKFFSLLVRFLFVWYLLFPLSCGCFARHPSTLLCSYPWNVQNACVQFVEGLKNLENLTLFKGFQILLVSIVTVLVKVKSLVEERKRCPSISVGTNMSSRAVSFSRMFSVRLSPHLDIHLSTASLA